MQSPMPPSAQQREKAMSEALRLADESTNLAERRLESDGYEWSVDADVQLRETAAELRRLAPMEAELQQALEELAALRAAVPAIPDDEVQAMAEEIERLQKALAFWMPDVPPTDHPLYKRVANDVYLLVGCDGPTTEPSAFELGHVLLAAIEANTPAAHEARIVECARRLVEHADFALGGCLSASSKAKDIPSKACSQVKARHLAALRDALSASPQAPQAAQPTGAVPNTEVVRPEGCERTQS
jgi:hypothetical protein